MLVGVWLTCWNGDSVGVLLSWGVLGGQGGCNISSALVTALTTPCFCLVHGHVSDCWLPQAVLWTGWKYA